MRKVIRVIKKPNTDIDTVNIQTDKSGIYPLPVRKKLDELAATFNWIHINPNDGYLELFCDHHILNTFRTCEAKFQEEIVNNLIPKGRNWSLSFGVAFHKWMEWFDEAEDKKFTGEWDDKEWFKKDNPLGVTFHNGNVITVANWIARCKLYWDDNKLDDFKDEKGFSALEGWNGTLTLLLQYWNTYSQGQERLRTVGTEIGFGKDKEVPIVIDPRRYWYAPFRAFLTGRIDRIVDNGRVIGIMDRKTHRWFKGKEESKYKPHDAFLGYIYALSTVLGNRFAFDGKPCNSVVIDMIALTEPAAKSKNKFRFKRAVRDFGRSEMLNFVERQVSTFSGIYETLVLGRPYQWNTSSCHNQYYRDCPYKMIHEAAPESRNSIINITGGTGYQYRDERWSPYKKPEEDANILADN